MVKIQKNARCPECGGMLRKIEGETDIVIRCVACGLVLRAVDSTDFDGELICEKVGHFGGYLAKEGRK